MSDSTDFRFSNPEKRAVAGLASIYFMRMLGLFLILPVFALYAEDLSGATHALAGLAIGIYGLTQALLQIPFGIASDRLGRKPVIVVGLLLFVAGSVVAAMSDSIWGIIVGRALQGSGAIAAAVMALNADLTREEVRTRAMASIGMSIGMAFFLSLLLGPALAHWIGVSGLFWLTAALALLALAMLAWVVPSPAVSSLHRDAQPVWSQLGAVLANKELLRLDGGIFVLHAVLTSLFVAVPFVLRDRLGLEPAMHSWVYLVVLLISVALMVPFVIMAERKRRMKPVFLGAVFAAVLAALGLSWMDDRLWWVGLCLVVFFAGFNVLEASLPSMVSKVAPADSKGSAMGVYSTSQFMGAFVGGSLGGVLMQAYGELGVFALDAALLVTWLLFAWGMRPPSAVTSRLLRVGRLDEVQARLLGERLSAVPGVAEAVVLVNEGVAYLKVDKRELDEAALMGALEQG